MFFDGWHLYPQTPPFPGQPRATSTTVLKRKGGRFPPPSSAVAQNPPGNPGGRRGPRPAPGRPVPDIQIPGGLVALKFPGDVPTPTVPLSVSFFPWGTAFKKCGNAVVLWTKAGPFMGNATIKRSPKNPNFGVFGNLRGGEVHHNPKTLPSVW